MFYYTEYLDTFFLKQTNKFDRCPRRRCPKTP